jgi:hypothetical protein
VFVVIRLRRRRITLRQDALLSALPEVTVSRETHGSGIEVVSGGELLPSKANFGAKRRANFCKSSQLTARVTTQSNTWLTSSARCARTTTFDMDLQASFRKTALRL